MTTSLLFATKKNIEPGDIYQEGSWLINRLIVFWNGWFHETIILLPLRSLLELGGQVFASLYNIYER